MRSLKLLLTAVATGALVAGPIAAAPAIAQSPPSYQSSDPAKDEMLDHPPSEVTVTFDQPLDQSSWMKVLDECGKEISSGAATVDLTEMTVPIGKTPAGMYEVVYKAVGLGTVTGASTSSFEFMVHHGKPCGGKKKPTHHHPKKDKDDEHNHNDDDPSPGHDDHDMDSGTTDHTSHSSGPSGSTGHSGHTMAPGSDHSGGHGDGHGKHGGRDPKRPATISDAPPTLAGGTAGAPVTADAEAVLVGLGLALAVGVLGGWLLRMSGKLTEA